MSHPRFPIQLAAELRRRSLLSLASLFLVAALPAQTAMMVKDLNTSTDVNTQGSDPDPAQAGTTNDLKLFAQIGPITFFAARTEAAGNELWSTLGTKATTQMVADLWPGKGNSDPAEMTVVGSLLFFVASDPVNGRELYVYNGTTVSLVADIAAGTDGSDPIGLAALGSKLVFGADDGKNGAELWITDGTKAGTSMLKDLYPGTTLQYGVQVPNSGSPSGMASDPAGKRVWFTADQGQGVEPWVTDGTVSGTLQVKDINATSATATSNPTSFRFVNGKALFQANDGTTGNELWVSDGTAAGTSLVLDIRPGTGAGALLTNSIVHNGLLYFRGNDTTAGAEAWVSDGTTSGTKLLVDAYPGTVAGQIFYPVVWKGKVVFGARSSAGYGLWTSDGTPSGTSQLVLAGNAALQWLAATTKGLVFGVNGGQGVEPWISDGTAAGTKQIADLNTTTASASSTPQYFIEAIPGTIVFVANDGQTGKEPWFTDGTAAGTVIADLNQPTVTPTLGSTPRSMAALGDKLLFAAQDTSLGRELFVSDGTSAGTTLLKDINTGTTGSNPNYLCRLGGAVLFQANDGTNGLELWVTDGTAAGTKLLKDIRGGSASSSPSYLTRVRDKVYFSANDGSGNELWVSDGTAAGTTLLKDINTSSATASSTPTSFTQIGSSAGFLFRATDGSNGIELWVSDGTAAGTAMVKDINAGSASSSPNNLTSIGGVVWFSANDGSLGNELWLSDGTAAGTKLLADIWPGSTASVPNYFAEIAGKVFFSARDPLAGTELYESDGTAAGTKLFRDFVPGFGKSGGRTSFESKVQVSDGTPSYLTTVGSRRLLFSVNTPLYGNDLFQTDGTQAGTKLAFDIAPANNSSNPLAQNDNFRNEFAVVGGRVFFAADDGVHGSELWVFDNGATANRVLYGCGGSTMTGTDPILGASFSLSGKAAGNPLVNVCLLGSPLPSAPAFGVGCPILVDIGKAMIVLPATVGQSWSFPAIPVPNDKGLLGVLVRGQSWHLTASFPAGTDLSNAVDLTIGN